jgi:gas vesicle protein
VFYAFLLGGLVGAAAALLLAPKSGKDTRRDIKDFAEDVKCKVTTYAEDVRESVSEGVRKGKEAVADRKTMLKSAVEAGKEAYVKEKERIERGDREESEEIS